MTEVTKTVYCDVLSEHDGIKIAGAKTYKNIPITKISEDGETVEITTATLDMCSDCYRKYMINLCVQFDPFTHKPTYSFKNESVNT